jgi:hypothetical protein
MTKGDAAMDDVSADIAEELLRIHCETYGNGAQRAHVVVCDDVMFRVAVERATGRRVVSFASIGKVSPNYVVGVFRLGPRRKARLVGAES